MKATLTFLGLLISGYLFSQVPYAFNYQTVVRNASGNIIPNQAVAFRFSIIQGNINASPVYGELQHDTTNEFGVITTTIGKQAPTFGQLDTLRWGNGNFYLKVEMDATGGNTYVNMGTTQLLSVPFSLYSARTGSVGQSATNYYGRGYVFVGPKDTTYQSIAGLDTTITAPLGCTALISTTGSVYGTDFSCLSSIRATLFIDDEIPAMGGSQVLRIVTDNNTSSGGANWTINYPIDLNPGPHTIAVKVKSTDVANQCNLTVDNGGYFDHSVLTVTFLRK